MPSLVRLVDVPREHLEIVWPLVERWIDDAARGSRYFTAQDVAKALGDGAAQMWLCWEGDKPQAVCVTQLPVCSKGKYCSIWIMTGSGRENWQSLVSEIEDWARREGCKFMRNEARAGWARVMKRYGYEAPHHIIEKDL